MNILFVEELLVIDFAYLCHERGLLGESLIVDVELHGDLDEEKVIFDFSYAKKKIKSFIDEKYDHKLWISSESEHLSLNKSLNDIEVRFELQNGSYIYHRSPEEAVSLIAVDAFKMDEIERIIEKDLLKILPENISGVKIKLRNEKIETPFFHYCHGLKKHYGNCQRIAHGHRSKIVVYKNDQRSETDEKLLGKILKDVYIGMYENLEENFKEDGIEYSKYRYESLQGLFELIVPKSSTYNMEEESTIECISEHFSRYLFEKYDGKYEITVRIYEGVKKGAIYRINC